MTPPGTARLSGLAAAFLAAAVAIVASLLGAVPASGTPTYAFFNIAAYVYDAPALLASQRLATTNARGSPPGPESASWGRSAFARDGVVATDTGASTVRNVLVSQPRQLQAKFGHAADFGVPGNYSSANAARFNKAIFEHINAPGTTSIRGTCRGDPVTHFLDSTTGLNVISRDGVFVSGWRLNPDQLANVLRNGSLGGG